MLIHCRGQEGAEVGDRIISFLNLVSLTLFFSTRRCLRTTLASVASMTRYDVPRAALRLLQHHAILLLQPGLIVGPCAGAEDGMAAVNPAASSAATDALVGRIFESIR